MKHSLLAIIILLSAGAHASNQFDQLETFREIQRLKNVEGDNDGAYSMGKQLLTQLSHKDELYHATNEIVGGLNSGNPSFDLEKAIQFATGEKDEYYCKNVGLVFITLRHNDKTTSELRLIASNRKMLNDNSYSRIVSGDWIYELDTEYRDPVKSDSWLLDGTINSYKLREFRRRPNNEVDRGEWGASWTKTTSSHSFHTSGDTPEPLPMHMANDYHLWGSIDLGFDIKFEVGSSETRKSFETGAPKKIVLKSIRTVLEKLPQFTYRDSTSKLYSHSDCFKVQVKVALDHLEDLKN